MSRVLIAVDVQNDFLDTFEKRDTNPTRILKAALPVPNGHEVIRPLVMLAKEVDLVVATMDWHPVTHSSFKEVGGQWPMHCVEGTLGAELDPQINYAADIIVRKGQVDGSDGYSGFEGTRLGNILQWARNESAADFDEILIGGLATDYCVAATAMDARAYFNDVRIVVVSDASRGIWTEQTEENLLGFFKADGIEYLTRAEL